MIVLYDVTNLAHRAFHASGPMTDSDDQSVGMVVGTIKILRKVRAHLREQFPAEHLFEVGLMDHGRCMWRTELYPEYKAGRKKEKPADFLPQIKRTEMTLPDFGLPIYKTLGVEADDLIGVLSAEFEDRTEENIVIVSSDKDLWQLISNRTSVFDVHEYKMVDARACAEYFTVPPERVVEYKALCGDASDNLPGGKGIGEKTAEALLAKYPDILQLLSEVDGTDDKVLKKVAASKDNIRLTGRLATIPRSNDELFTQDAKHMVEQIVDRTLNGYNPKNEEQIQIHLNILGLDPAEAIQ